MTRPTENRKFVTRPESPSDLGTTLINPVMDSLVVHCLSDRASVRTRPVTDSVPDPNDDFKNWQKWLTYPGQPGTRGIRHDVADLVMYLVGTRAAEHKGGNWGM